MEVNTYLTIVIAIIVIEFLVSLAVSLLDFYHKPEPTKNQTIKKDYVKAKRYLRTGIKFGIVKSIVDTVILLIVVFSGVLNNLDLFVRALGYGPVMTGILFFGVIGAVASLVGLPFSIFNIFFIEKKYGFNKTTKKTFVLDILKSILGWIIVGAVGLAIILLFFQKAGDMAWLYCWIALTLIQIFTMFIYPVFILPMFNNLKILKDGELKEAIRNYLTANNVNIKMDNIRIMDSSRRTKKSNAFLAGFGNNKRLVLSDTLLKNHSLPEILAVVAHEVGHLKMTHLPKKLTVYAIETFLMMLLLSFVITSSNFFLAFGVENLSVYIGLMLFSIVYSPIALFFSTFTNYTSRKYEYGADQFSAETTTPKDMASALDKLGSHNLTNPTPHPLKVFLQYSHPPIQDRIRILNMAKREVEHNG